MIHKAAGALSWLQATGEDDTPLENDLLLLAIGAKSGNTSILVINANSDNIILLKAQKKRSIKTPPTLEEPINKQTDDEYCKAVSLNVDHAGS